MAVMGLPGPVAFAVLKERCGIDDSVETLAAECDELFEDLLPAGIEMMPGLAELMELLESQGIPKAVATSSHAVFADRALGIFNFQPRFEFVLTSESVTQGKPHPEIYLTAAEKHGVLPEEMLVLEDSVHGSNAAIAAGAITIGIPSGRVDPAKFGSVYAICDRLDDSRVLDLIRN